MKRHQLILLLILLLFLSTRLYKIADIPSSVYWDEASIGYNAYSILQTGKDEWGKAFPIHFRAFDEFKLPVYIYSTVVSEAIFGLDNLAVRLPAVFFSLGSVILIYPLTLKISAKKEAALLAAFFLTVSPWLFIFSRTGYEATAGLMFFLLGLWTFLKFEENYYWILFSVLSFIGSIYSYNSFRIIVPITLLGLAGYFLKETSLFKQSRKYWKKLVVTVTASIILLGLGAVPIIRVTTLDSGGARLQQVGIFNSDKSKAQLAQTFVQNYLTHFNPQFLFVQGDKNLRSQQLGFGQLYWADLPLLVLGLIYIIRSRKLLTWLPVALLLVGPVPAALTLEVPHALRSIVMAPSLAMIAALGVLMIPATWKYRRWVLDAIVAVYLISFGNYFGYFLSSYPQDASADWQYAYSQAFTNYSTQGYDKMVITDSYAQPYIFGLYYLKYNPNQFRSQVSYNPVDKWGFSNVKSFGKYLFQPINLKTLPKGKLLIFAAPNEKLKNITPESVIKNLDGTPALYVYRYVND